MKTKLFSIILAVTILIAGVFVVVTVYAGNNKEEASTTVVTTTLPETTTKVETTTQAETTTQIVTTTELTTQKETTTKKETTTQKETTTKKETTTQKEEQKSSGHLTKSGGVYYYNGHKETWYSSNESGQTVTAREIPGKYLDSNGLYRDADGYICVAADFDYLAPYSIVETSLGTAKVYDCGCSYGTIDIYTNW